MDLVALVAYSMDNHSILMPQLLEIKRLLKENLTRRFSEIFTIITSFFSKMKYIYFWKTPYFKPNSKEKCYKFVRYLFVCWHKTFVPMST